MPNRHPMLEHFEVLVGTWETAATHPLLPNTTIHGRATFEWLEGNHFLVWRVHYDHSDIPDSISIIGFDNAVDPDAVGRGDAPCAVHYFDERGVSRVSQTAAGPGVWRVWRDWPGFSQRVTATFSDDGDTIVLPGELSEDDATWKPDLTVTYRRVS
jgi:hypothetical protein